MSTSRRTEPLPQGWEVVRHRIAGRDHNRCQLGYTGCMRVAALDHGGETDHIVPASQGGTEDDSNLQHVCCVCHRRKTAHEANQARPRYKRKRPASVSHPGIK